MTDENEKIQERLNLFRLIMICLFLMNIALAGVVFGLEGKIRSVHEENEALFALTMKQDKLIADTASIASAQVTLSSREVKKTQDKAFSAFNSTLDQTTEETKNLTEAYKYLVILTTSLDIRMKNLESREMNLIDITTKLNAWNKFFKENGEFQYVAYHNRKGRKHYEPIIKKMIQDAKKDRERMGNIFEELGRQQKHLSSNSLEIEKLKPRKKK